MKLLQRQIVKHKIGQRRFSSLIIPLILGAIFLNINSMWMHPDSMTSGGLRFLSGNWSTFHFATYGPFAYLFSGFMNGVLFPIGVVVGSWKTKMSFEEGYRTNHVDVLNISFTNFSLLINFVLIIFSIYYITKIFPDRSEIYVQDLKLFLLLLAIPLFLNQLTLDTIEIYTFFGISLALYVSFLQVRREVKAKLVDYFLVSVSFLSTIGIRISLAILIIPIFFLVGIHKYRRNNFLSELFVPITASIITLISYLPLILNRVEFSSTIQMYRSLSGLDFNAETLHRNLTVLILNFGNSILLAVPAFVLILPIINRDRLTKDHALLLIWLSLGIIHTLLFLFNRNGFPKYLIPILPILLLLLDHTYRLETLKKVRYLRIYKKFYTVVFLFVCLILGIINFNNFQSHSSFDTREQILQILPEGKGWMKDATANITVITELSRGKYGITYEELIRRISQFVMDGSDCKKFLIVSDREVSIKQMSHAAQLCGYRMGEYASIEISPYIDSSANTSSDEWLGFLSLGTPVDPNRRGFGPHYEMLFLRDWAYASELLANCTSSKYCRTIQN